jgi:hypothetical protein
MDDGDGEETGGVTGRQQRRAVYEREWSREIEGRRVM